jgi:hypothetical protein
MIEALYQLGLSAIRGETKGGYFPCFESLSMFNVEAKGFINSDLFWLETCILPSFASFSIFEAYFYPGAGLFHGKAGLVK